jgi:hypothetical protein
MGGVISVIMTEDPPSGDVHNDPLRGAAHISVLYSIELHTRY